MTQSDYFNRRRLKYPEIFRHRAVFVALYCNVFGVLVTAHTLWIMLQRNIETFQTVLKLQQGVPSRHRLNPSRGAPCRARVRLEVRGLGVGEYPKTQRVRVLGFPYV